MIVYDLKCAGGHRFEGWFSSAEDFTSQKARQILNCPTCADDQIERMPSVTRINMGAVENPPAPAGSANKDAFAIAQMLYSKMLDELLTKSEDVGKQFPEEARRIFYQESPARAIRGVATQAEHDELVEEGVPVARLPVPPADQMN